MINEKLQTQILEKSSELCSKDSQPFDNSQYPNIISILECYFFEKNIHLPSNCLNILCEDLSIDSDGIPCIKYDIGIKNTSLKAKVEACHHTGWDFYLLEIS